MDPQNSQNDNETLAQREARLAADVIRQKVANIYGEEPDAQQEMSEAAAVSHKSIHQQYMDNLRQSGKDLAAIQTEWHNYYQNLPAKQKHEVWHEFYASQSSVTQPGAAEQVNEDPHKIAQHKQEAATTKREKASRTKPKVAKLRDARSKADIQKALRDKVTAGGKLETKHHLQSLLFGFGMGAVVLVIFLFSFFNEVIIAPFIQPSRVEASTPLIVNESTVAATDEPKVIIPKINVEIPVDYNQTTTDEAQIENALDSAVVHYPSTVKPGENGNAAIFGHSSNNIFNKGKYKFAFVLLHTLVEGDTFYLTYNKKVYVYKVITKKVVNPSEVGVLGPVPGKNATATLITCDPPGTSLNRLIIIGEQISPDPTTNTQAAATNVTPTTNGDSQSAALPGNGPTLFGRLIGSAFGKLLIIALVIAAFWWGVRRFNKPRFA